MYHMHSPASEVELMPYWEFEMMVETLQDVLKKKQDADKKAYHETESYQSGANPSSQANSLMKSASSSMPKAPSMPSPSSFRMPKI